MCEFPNNIHKWRPGLRRYKAHLNTDLRVLRILGINKSLDGKFSYGILQRFFTSYPTNFAILSEKFYEILFLFEFFALRFGNSARHGNGNKPRTFVFRQIFFRESASCLELIYNFSGLELALFQFYGDYEVRTVHTISNEKKIASGLMSDIQLP